MTNGADNHKMKGLRAAGHIRQPISTRTAVGLGVALLWTAIGCHRATAHAQDSAFSYQGGAQDSNQPDYSNLAPVDGQYPAQNEAQQQAYQYSQGGYPQAGASQGNYPQNSYPQGAPVERPYPGADPNGYPQNGDPNTYYDDQAATEQAQAVYEADLTDEEAAEPPPALPDYDQPPPPDEDYIWTPGYWAWALEGYYWVPGAWVEPPYVGALWTPGYWAFYGGRYRFHHGFWGLHIGFYGGINYGYGYTGYGYYGGYWRSGHFFYNREVNHIVDTRRFLCTTTA